MNKGTVSSVKIGESQEMPSSPEVKLDHFEIRTIILRTDQSSGSVENDQE